MHCWEVHLQFALHLCTAITRGGDRSIPPSRPRRRTALPALLAVYKQMHVQTMTVAARSLARVGLQVHK